jgi:hypothetical protein
MVGAHLRCIVQVEIKYINVPGTSPRNISMPPFKVKAASQPTRVDLIGDGSRSNGITGHHIISINVADRLYTYYYNLLIYYINNI